MAVKLKLSEISLFQFVTKEDAEKLSPIAKIISKNKGDLVLIYGEEVPGIFLVAEGKVGVYAEKTEIKIAEIEAGGSVGEMSFVDSAKASATIRCETDNTKIIFFKRDEFELLLKKEPLIASAIFNGISYTLSQRLRDTNNNITSELASGMKLISQFDTTKSIKGEKDTNFFDEQKEKIHFGINSALETFKKEVEDFDDAKRKTEQFQKTCDQIKKDYQVYHDQIEKFALETLTFLKKMQETFHKTTSYK